jgi:hypothetical protein
LKRAPSPHPETTEIEIRPFFELGKGVDASMLDADGCVPTSDS